MSFETDFRAFLAANAPIAALVGTRIYPVVPAQKASLPHLVYTRLDTQRGHTHSGPEGLQRPRLLVTCWAETFLVSRDLADKVRLALDGYRGAMGSTVIQAAFIAGDSDTFEFDTKLFCSDLEFEVWAEESVS